MGVLFGAEGVPFTMGVVPFATGVLLVAGLGWRSLVSMVLVLRLDVRVTGGLKGLALALRSAGAGLVMGPCEFVCLTAPVAAPVVPM